MPGQPETPPPMLTCGHAANAVQTMPDGSRVPACAICDCNEVAQQQPDLTGRRMRCSYFGRATSTRNNEGPCRTMPSGAPCTCEQPSSLSAAFFQQHPDEDFDEFYCGCWSWD